MWALGQEERLQVAAWLNHRSNWDGDPFLRANAHELLEEPGVFVLRTSSDIRIEGGLGACAAQMAAAQRFNIQAGHADQIVFGCVTTGEVWQFLRLTGHSLVVDHDRLYLGNLGSLLAALLRAVGHAGTL